MLREAVVIALLAAACAQRKTAPASEPATATAKTSSAVTPTSPQTSPPASPPTTATNDASTTDLGLGAAVVHVPKALAPNEKAPLVVILHGLGATSAAIDQYSDFPSFAEEKRIAWVAPDGPRDKKGRQFWNAGPTCCNFDDIAVDHVSALRSLITRATATHPVDPKRVFVVGYSNGGFMAHRLGCELDGLVAGIASVAGAGTNADEPCAAKGPLRVLEVHGDADPIVNIAGGPLFADSSYPSSISASQTVSDWAKRLDCKPKPTAAGTIDFEAQLADAETTVTRFEGCQRGAVELWTVMGGGHYVGLRRPSYEAMWNFLSAS
ncbi:MAG TPA: PHB depolymerase family esterase [Polyangiaceae bacterium]|nr:PHB depolymerase family esterase [Polyangiaceae bacterium]